MIGLLPSLADGIHDVGPGKVAEVITYLEMTAPPAAGSTLPTVRLDRQIYPNLEQHLDLFRRIGEPWLWASRLMVDEDALGRHFMDPAVEIYSAMQDEAEVGLVELNRAVPGETEIAWFGMIPTAVGKGLGRAAMQATLRLAFTSETKRVWLHTCQFDHPKALAFYKAAGFVPYDLKVAIWDDPRMTGILPRQCAPHVPLIPGAQQPG